MKITEEEQLIRRDRIINTAFALFCKKGIEKVSLSEVAHQARVGESSIYRYFSNKPALVLNTLSVLWKSIGIKLEQTVQGTPSYAAMNGLEQFALWLECCRKVYLGNTDYVLFSYESKLYLQRNGVSLSREEYDSLMEEIKIPFIAALEKGKADGSIPSAENSEDLFYAIWGALRGYIVKIVIYQSLCRDNNPWVNRYEVVKNGILSALSAGWQHPPLKQGANIL